MRLNKLGFILCLALAADFSEVYGQDLRSAYFLDGYYYRHQMNPAFMAERPYFSMPAFGNMDMSANGNVGISNFLYRYDDPMSESLLTTFMHKSVGQEEFLQSLKARNKVSANVDMSLLSVGFNGWGGFNTVGVGFHSRNNIHAPYELFDFMKSGELGGAGKKEYRIRDVRVSSTNYIDISFNHARKLNDRLAIGATLKVLVGAANLDSRFDDMQITMDENEWLIHANGYTHASAKNASFDTKQDNEIEDITFGSPGVNGLGMGVDLGAEYRLTDELSFSAGVVDLGFIRWFNTLEGTTLNAPYSFKGFETIGVGSDSEYPTLEDQLDDLQADFEDMARLYDNGTVNKLTRLGATVNVGAHYKLPVYKKLSFGLLSSTHINRPYTWSEARASVNVAPVKWFEAALSGAWSTYGPGFGVLVNFHPKGFNFFVGSDFMITEVTPQFVPVNNLNVNLSMGINFVLGDLRN